MTRRRVAAANGRLGGRCCWRGRRVQQRDIDRLRRRRQRRYHAARWCRGRLPLIEPSKIEFELGARVVLPIRGHPTLETQAWLGGGWACLWGGRMM